MISDNAVQWTKTFSGARDYLVQLLVQPALISEQLLP